MNDFLSFLMRSSWQELALMVTCVLLEIFLIVLSLRTAKLVRQYRRVMVGEDKVVIKNYSFKKPFIPQRTIELWHRGLAAPLQWIFGKAYFSYTDIAALYIVIILFVFAIRLLLQIT